MTKLRQSIPFLLAVLRVYIAEMRFPEAFLGGSLQLHYNEKSVAFRLHLNRKFIPHIGSNDLLNHHQRNIPFFFFGGVCEPEELSIRIWLQSRRI